MVVKMERKGHFENSQMIDSDRGVKQNDKSILSHSKYSNIGDWGNSILWIEIGTFYMKVSQLLQRDDLSILSKDCCCLVSKLCPVVFQPFGRQPARLFCLWDFPSKNPGVDCHFFLQRNLPNPEIKPPSPALAGRFFTIELPGKP